MPSLAHNETKLNLLTIADGIRIKARTSRRTVRLENLAFVLQLRVTSWYVRCFRAPRVASSALSSVSKSRMIPEYGQDQNHIVDIGDDALRLTRRWTLYLGKSGS